MRAVISVLIMVSDICNLLRDPSTLNNQLFSSICPIDSLQPLTFVCTLQEMSAPVIDGNDPVTGHIISTTIGGKNGEPKQVKIHINPSPLTFYFHMFMQKNVETQFSCCWPTFYIILHELMLFLLFLGPVDHKLHGRTCCWDWIIWYCFQGILHVIPLSV